MKFRRREKVSGVGDRDVCVASRCFLQLKLSEVNRGRFIQKLVIRNYFSTLSD